MYKLPHFSFNVICVRALHPPELLLLETCTNLDTGKREEEGTKEGALSLHRVGKGEGQVLLRPPHQDWMLHMKIMSLLCQLLMLLVLLPTHLQDEPICA